MTALFVHMAFLIALNGFVITENLQEEKIYTVSEVTEKPAPLIGLNAFQDKWSKRVIYPEAAIKKNIQGTVFIEFIVDKDSTVHDAAVRAGIGAGCDEAALHVFEDLSKNGWKPGILKNEPVKVKMVLPFFFRIMQSRNGRR
ncbi:MAG TPA: energy transducer TonB [Chryseosolibacter sp.]|nr:energy transducer TonB [Chryseosolibacter sp.]